MKKYSTLLIGGGIVLLLIIIYVTNYNMLVTTQEKVNGAWSQVQNQYQRRIDLIPNLVETVKGYARQEERVLTEVTAMRSRVGSITASKDILDNPAEFQKFQEAQNQLGGALSRLLVVTENYPDLKSNQNFLALQSQLEGTENRIAVERRRFNDVVQDYNTKIKRIPSSIVASIAGFKEKAYFQAQQGAETAPKVSF